MPRTDFDQLPGDARLWLFGSDRPLADPERKVIEASTTRFLDDWTAHQRALRAGACTLERRFLAVAVDESGVGASGCSIDKLVEHVRSIGRDTRTDWLGQRVYYRDASGTVRSCARPGFGDLAAAGEIDLDTPVFDLTLDRVGALADGFERPASQSWHRRLIEAAAASTGV